MTRNVRTYKGTVKGSFKSDIKNGDKMITLSHEFLEMAMALNSTPVNFKKIMYILTSRLPTGKKTSYPYLYGFAITELFYLENIHKIQRQSLSSRLSSGHKYGTPEWDSFLVDSFTSKCKTLNEAFASAKSNQ